MLRKTFVLVVLAAIVLALSSRYALQAGPAFHGQAELDYLRGVIDSLPDTANALFWGSGKCGSCHGFDDLGVAMLDENGNDINVTDDWRSTMMANSAKDPFWRAKVSHEVAVNPAHQVELEDKCTACHAPQGNFAAKHLGATHYSIADMLNDEVALDGVSCSACHQQVADNIGQTFSGEVNYGQNDSVIYGPYFNMFEGPMNDFVGRKPLYGPHVVDAGFCASCHTLITGTVDLNGNSTGGEFVEQATYHEWLNSQYNSDENTITCQGCHLPRIEDQVIISNGYDFLDGNSPFGLHELVGGNAFMLKLLKNNITTLGLSATTENFDSTIARTMEMLQEQTLEMELVQEARTADTAFYALTLENKAGHKFPSGYPARRAFVEFVALDEQGDTLFKSGVLQSDYEVEGQNATYEPHYNMINDQAQVQIYEMVMGDVNGDVTTVLERADHPIKDNRLTPKGFTTSHFAYDTCLIAGLATADADFNINDNGSEGSGTDEVHYHVPTLGYEGDITVSARVYYQSAPPKWMQEMFAVSTPEIDLFKTMYNAADQSPVLMAEAEHVDVSYGLEEQSTALFEVWPNPTTDGTVQLLRSNGGEAQLFIYSASGKLIATEIVRSQQVSMVLPAVAGAYIIVLKDNEQTTVQRVIRK